MKVPALVVEQVAQGLTGMDHPHWVELAFYLRAHSFQLFRRLYSRQVAMEPNLERRQTKLKQFHLVQVEMVITLRGAFQLLHLAKTELL
jgi:hypothetical protein